MIKYSIGEGFRYKYNNIIRDNSSYFDLIIMEYNQDKDTYIVYVCENKSRMEVSSTALSEMIYDEKDMEVTNTYFNRLSLVDGD